MNKCKIIFILIFAIFATSIFGKEGEHLRIVSLSPCLTELIFHLGEQKKLVGRSSACDFPVAAKKIKSVGGFANPSLEALLALRPDVVVSSALANPAIKNSIEQFGIKFYLLPAKSIDDYFRTVKAMGKILNCNAKAANEIQRVKIGLAKFAEKNKRSNRRSPRVYLEIWDKPYMTIGSESFINDLIKYAGGENIAKNQKEGYFNCSVEWVITSDPEIIICPAMKTGREADVKQRKGWEKIKAITNSRVYVNLNDDLIYRLGPRILTGIQELSEIINTGNQN